MTAPNHPSGLSDKTVDTLRTAARSAAANAYAPYSHFRVGAALLLDGVGQEIVVAGCNVENASYRITTCAEQTAIVSAIALHGPAIRIRAIAVANLNRALSAPCGACRQMINEFSTPETWVLLPVEDGLDRDCSFADLLPLAFGSQNLNSQP